MARYTGPKNKLSRRHGIDLFNKGAKMRRLNVPPGVHGPKGAPKTSEYGDQLREKQKVRRFYGVLEKQFRRYYDHAATQHGVTGAALLTNLELRLDNVLVRGGLCPTRAMARQLVTHRHVFIDGKIVNIPSYQVKPDQVITLNTKALAIPTVVKYIAQEIENLPDWLQRKAAAVKISRLPQREDINEDFNEQTIVEFYSR